MRRGLWGASTGPAILGRELARYRVGTQYAADKNIDAAAKTWRSLADDLAQSHPAEAVWLYCLAGRLLIAPVSTGFYKDEHDEEGQRVRDADALFERAVSAARATGDRSVQAYVFEQSGAAWRIDVLEPDRASLGRARPAFANALTLRESSDPGSLAEAAAAHCLAAAWTWQDDGMKRPDFATARTLYERALRIRRTLAPGSFEEGYSELGLAVLLFEHFPADADQSFDYASRALANLRRTAPGTQTLRIARVLMALLAGDRGDFQGAEKLLLASREPAVHTSADSDIRTLRRYGHQEGDATLLGAQARQKLLLGLTDAFVSVMRLRAALLGTAPPTFRVETSHGGLTGQLSAEQLLVFGDYASDLGYKRFAHEFYDQAGRLAATQSDPPIGIDRDASCLASAHAIILGEGSQDDSNRVHGPCVAWAEIESRSRDPYGEYLLLLARAYRAERDWSSAADLARRAAALRRSAAGRRWQGEPWLIVGASECAGGAVAQGLADLQNARLSLRPLESRPDLMAEALRALGDCALKAGRRDLAAGWLAGAINFLEARSTKELSSNLARAFETAASADLRAEFSGLLVDEGRFNDALRAAEDGRARALRRLLSERSLPDFDFAPWARNARQRDLARRRALLDEYARVCERLAAQRDPAKAMTDLLRVQTLILELDANEQSLRQHYLPVSHRQLAATRASQAADSRSITKALDDGSVLLEYSVGENATRLFVLEQRAGNKVAALTLPVGRDRLLAEIAAFRSRVENGATKEGDLASRGRALYDLLIRPAESMVAGARHVVIVPDGPLWALPFSALVRTGPHGETQFLVEWKPVQTAPSAATFVMLRGREAETSHRAGLAVGDPLSGAERMLSQASVQRGEMEVDRRGVQDEVTLRSSTRGGRLPGSDVEVRNIQSIMGSTQVLIGPEATEARVRSQLNSVQFAHFATHAVVNSAFLLNSGLRLASPSSNTAASADDGFLQGWELLEEFNMKAELVTMAACESAGGQLLPGEGAMSLGRAFHGAGARSVIAALWAIDDRATADLMTALYQGIAAGLTKDEALRSAQMSFIRAADRRARWAAPRFWAAFQLSGDW